ncbi:hypothetical protein [Bradyrhizobium sacchari]|uniref:hypothetical protein n=1 Tax=Bradyrhizobium sacchari TaxID=1399419 RepID=UPI0010A97C68|nr:hypothetical protein [Bradyrhizobium sacchari]
MSAYFSRAHGLDPSGDSHGEAELDDRPRPDNDRVFVFRWRSRVLALLRESPMSGVGVATPHAEIAIAVSLADGARVLGSINIVWLSTAFSVKVFARHLEELQGAHRKLSVQCEVAERAEGGFWPSGVAPRLTEVRSSRQSGPDLLNLSSSQVDPNRT